MDVLDSVIRSGVSLARSVELIVEWGKILWTGPVYPVTLDDLQSVWDGGIGEFRRVAGDLHCRLTDFVHKVVVLNSTPHMSHFSQCCTTNDTHTRGSSRKFGVTILGGAREKIPKKSSTSELVKEQQKERGYPLCSFFTKLLGSDTLQDFFCCSQIVYS